MWRFVVWFTGVRGLVMRLSGCRMLDKNRGKHTPKLTLWFWDLKSLSKCLCSFDPETPQRRDISMLPGAPAHFLP